jgi:hypothetical protein
LPAFTLLFDVEVDNPYSVALPLLNMDYNVASGIQLYSIRAIIMGALEAEKA